MTERYRTERLLLVLSLTLTCSIILRDTSLAPALVVVAPVALESVHLLETSHQVRHLTNTSLILTWLYFFIVTGVSFNSMCCMSNFVIVRILTFNTYTLMQVLSHPLLCFQGIRYSALEYQCHQIFQYLLLNLLDLDLFYSHLVFLAWVLRDIY